MQSLLWILGLLGLVQLSLSQYTCPDNSNATRTCTSTASCGNPNDYQCIQGATAGSVLVCCPTCRKKQKDSVGFQNGFNRVIAIGAPSVDCEPGGGKYKDKQCSGSSGYCRCVTEYGMEIPNTSVPPGRTPINCTAARISFQQGTGGITIGRVLEMCGTARTQGMSCQTRFSGPQCVCPPDQTCISTRTGGACFASGTNSGSIRPICGTFAAQGKGCQTFAGPTCDCPTGQRCYTPPGSADTGYCVSSNGGQQLRYCNSGEACSGGSNPFFRASCICRSGQECRVQSNMPGAQGMCTQIINGGQQRTCGPRDPCRGNGNIFGTQPNCTCPTGQLCNTQNLPPGSYAYCAQSFGQQRICGVRDPCMGNSNIFGQQPQPCSCPTGQQCIASRTPGSYSYCGSARVTATDPSTTAARAAIVEMETSRGTNNRNITGVIRFDPEGSGIRVRGTIYGLPAGTHGLHIHELGDITSGCTAGGSHFNPEGRNHGAPTATDRHVGDLGNIQATSTFGTSYPNAAATAYVNILDNKGIYHELRNGYYCKYGENPLIDAATNQPKGSSPCAYGQPNACPQGFKCYFSISRSTYSCCGPSTGPLNPSISGSFQTFVYPSDTCSNRGSVYKVGSFAPSCTLNSGQLQAPCPPGYACQFSHSTARFVCCSVQGSDKCPSGSYPYMVNSMIQTCNIDGTICPVGYSCIYSALSNMYMCCGESIASSTGQCPGGGQPYANLNNNQVFSCNSNLVVECPQGYTCQFVSQVQGRLCCPLQARMTTYRCYQQVERGEKCTVVDFGVQIRWYFDPASTKCKQFQFLGCKGNANSFLSQYDCNNACLL